MKRELFNVLVGERGNSVVQVGIGTGNGKVRVIEICQGKVTQKTTTDASAASELVALVRKGYRQVATNWYFDANESAFKERHPDFRGQQQAAPTYVLYADVGEDGDIAQAVRQLDALVSTCKVQGLPRHVIRDELRQFDQADAYLIAERSHPLWAIAIAELAIRNKWALAGSRPDMPLQAPSVDPFGWTAWLDSFFAQETTHATLLALDFSAAKLINDAANAAAVTALAQEQRAGDCF